MAASRSATSSVSEAQPHRREVLRVENLMKAYRLRGNLLGHSGSVQAVDGVSFSLAEGETLALVGESGCGKSTTARLIMGLERPDGGRVFVGGEQVRGIRRRQLAPVRRNVQIVFQDPYDALDPRMRIRDSVGEPLLVQVRGRKRERETEVERLLGLVGLRGNLADSYPHELSGGQRQRVSIARALSVNPKLVVLDEAVSALDVSVQAQIINLLADLQQALGLSYLFISHDLGVVEQIADRIAVMYLGRIVEIGSRDTILARPSHPYTQALLSAVPIAEPALRGQKKRIRARTDVLDTAEPTVGCAFQPRCFKAAEACRVAPELTQHPGVPQDVACHFAGKDPEGTA